jgi:hypothetical protein
MTEREQKDLRETSAPLNTSEEGGDEDCIESVVSEAAELEGGSQYTAPASSDTGRDLPPWRR